MAQNDSSGENSPDDERDLWQAYAANRSLEIRQQLFEIYLPFCRYCAVSVYNRHPRSGVEFGDYMQFGITGLLEAIDRFDIARGTNFKGYARYRIQGAINNGAAQLTERNAQASTARAIHGERAKSLIDDAKPKASDAFEELASVAVGLAIGFVLDESDDAIKNAGGAPTSPFAAQVLGESRRHLLAAIETLTDRQAQIIRLHYLEHVKFVDIATLLGVSKGRVAQIHREALHNMRAHFEATNRYFESF